MKSIITAAFALAMSFITSSALAATPTTPIVNVNGTAVTVQNTETDAGGYNWTGNFAATLTVPVTSPLTTSTQLKLKSFTFWSRGTVSNNSYADTVTITVDDKAYTTSQYTGNTADNNELVYTFPAGSEPVVTAGTTYSLSFTLRSGPTGLRYRAAAQGSGSDGFFKIGTNGDYAPQMLLTAEIYTPPPTPLVMWDDDFASETKNGFTLSVRGGEEISTDKSYVEIKSSGKADAGLSIIKSDNTNIGENATGSIIFKVSNLPSSIANAFLISLRNSGKNDPVGIFLDNSTSGVLKPALISGGNKTSTRGTEFNNDSGTHKFAVVRASTSTLNFYEIVDGVPVALATFTGTNTNPSPFSGLVLGGMWAGSSDGIVSATGMKIDAVAVFSEILTADQAAAYEFPSDNVPAVPRIISINITNANTTDVNTDIQTLASDDLIPAGGWINVGYPAVNGERKGSTSTVKYAKGTETGTISGATFTWTSTGTSFQNMLNSIGSSITFMKDAYCRGSGASLEGSTFTLTGVPYKDYDVIVYISGKTANVNKSITVNGTAYYGGEVNDAHPYGTYIGDSTSWGSVNAPSTLVMGQNAIRVTDQTDSTLVVSTPNPFGGNWGVAAIQVVERFISETEIEIEDEAVTVSAINAKLEGAAATDIVKLTLTNARTFEFDAAFKCAQCKVVYDGDLVLTGAEEGVAPAVDYLAKVDFSGVTGAITYSWLATGSGIAINFHKDSGSTPAANDSNIPDLALKGSCWNNTEGATGEIDAAIFSSGGESIAVGTAKAIWESNTTYQGTGGNDFLGGYLDDGGDCVHINVDVPFALYDVIIFAATDMYDIKFQPFTVNGTKYTWNDDVGMTVAGSEIWGISREATPVYGKNVIRVPQQTASKLTIVGESRNGSIARGCVAAIVIVKVNPPMDHTIECGDGKAMSAINAEVAGQGYEQVTLKFNNAATLTIDEAPARAYIVSDEGSLNLNYTLSEVTSLAYLDLAGVAGAMSLTTGVGLGFDYGAKAFTYTYNGQDEITPAINGTGAFTKAGSGTLKLLGTFGPASVTVAEGILVHPDTVDWPAFCGNGDTEQKFVTVLAGAQFDLANSKNRSIRFNIAGNGPNGATSASALFKSGNGGSSGEIGVGQEIILSDNATIDVVEGKIWRLINGGVRPDYLRLDAYTLTKIGNGELQLANTTVTGTGMLKVAAGTLSLLNAGCSMPDGTILLDGGNFNVSQAFTLKNLTIKNGALTGNGALTLTGALKIDGTTVDFSSRALPLPGTLTADSTGTLKIAKPTSPTKIIAGTEIPAGFKIADADGNEITDVCCYNGYIWYGTLGTGTYALTDGDLAAIGQLQSGGLYSPTSLEVNISAIGGTPAGYTAWIENGIMYVAKHTPERSISIKMNPRSDTEGKIATTDTNVGAYKVTGKFWNHSKNYNNNNNGTTEIFTLIDGAGEQAQDADGNPTLCYYYMPNSYFAANDQQTTGNGKLTRTYFDDTRRITDVTWPYSVGTYNETEYFLPETPKLHDCDKGELCWEVAITNIPYQVFDLYIYHASDQTGSSITLLPIAVKANNKPWMFFKGDTAGSQSCAINSTWNGAPYVDSETLHEGVNYIRYRMSKAALGLANDEKLECVYLSHPSRRDANGRLGLAGVQIVEVENDGFYTRTATEGGWLTEGSWKNSNNAPISWANPSGSDIAYATIDVDVVSSIDLDGEISATAVTLVNAEPIDGEGEKVFTFTNTSGEGSLTTPTIDASGFYGKIVTCTGMSASINLGEHAHLEVEIPEGTEKSLEELIPGISIAGGSVKLTGAGTLVCDGELPETYKASLQSSDWQGTVWIKNVIVPDVGKHISAFGDYKNANSAIRLTGVRGWLSNGDQNVELELKDDGDTLGLEIQDSSQNYKYLFPKFTGDGSFKAATTATSAAAYFISDVSEFKGALLSTPGMYVMNGIEPYATVARPIYVGYGTNEKDALTKSLISVKAGVIVNANCGWEAAEVEFGDTLIVNGAVGDTIVSGVTTAPTLNTSVTLKNAQGETVEGEYALGYDSEAQSVKIVRVVTVTIPEIANTTVAVTGGTLVGTTATVPYGETLTVTYTLEENFVFLDGTMEAKALEFPNVTEAPIIDVSGIKTVKVSPEEPSETGDVKVYTDETGNELILAATNKEGYTGDGVKLSEKISNYESITNIVIGKGVKRIGQRYFKDFSGLTTIKGGKDLEKFDEKAFYRCMSLEKIEIDNPNFDLNSLTNSVIYQMALDNEGKFFMIPSIQVSGYTENLWGKKSLNTKTDDWEKIGELKDQDLESLKKGNVYHFFRTQLDPETAE